MSATVSRICNTNKMSVSVSEKDNVSDNVLRDDNVSETRIYNTNIMSGSVSELDNVSDSVLRGDNVSVPKICNVSGETDVMADTVEHVQGGVQDGGDGQEGGDQHGHGHGGAADVRGERLGPGGGHGLLVVTGKRRGRPKKGIVPDGLVQLRIQNFVTKYDLGRGGGGSLIMGGGGERVLVRGVLKGRV